MDKGVKENNVKDRYARHVKMEWVEENKRLKLEIKQYQQKLKIYEEEIEKLHLMMDME